MTKLIFEADDFDMQMCDSEAPYWNGDNCAEHVCMSPRAASRLLNNTEVRDCIYRLNVFIARNRL